MSLTADQVAAAVEASYPDGFVFFRELPHDGGFADSRIDLLAVAVWPSIAPTIEAVEIKVSRADFMRELRKPRKRSGWDGRCSAFWFAAPAGVIPRDRVPADCGLIEVGADGVVTRLIFAPRRPFAPTFALIRTLAKASGSGATYRSPKHPEAESDA